MAFEIKVPALGESIVEATVSRWLKREGDAVAAGEAVVELETDKVNLEVAAEQSGTIESIAKDEGETVEIGDVLGTLGEDGAAASATEEDDTADVAPAEDDTADVAPAENDTADVAPAENDTADVADEAPAEDSAEPPPDDYGRSEESPDGDETAASTPTPQREPAPAADPSTNGGGETLATPVAQRVAAEYNLDVRSITGSGPRGRVTKEDVLKQVQGATGQTQTAAAEPAKPAQPAPQPAEEKPAPAAAKPAAPAPAASNGEREERRRMSRRRQTIAKRLVEAQRTAAMLTTFNEVDMSAVMELRKRRKESFKDRHGVNLGFMSFFTKATIGALKAFPLLNAEIQENEIVVKHYYDIGIAVGTDEGLVVPVVRDADRKGFAAIESTISDLAKRARDGALSITDLQGGTFTITNGGIYGSLMSTPILNTPQVGILGLHKIEERPIAKEGEVVVRPMMYLALSYDHRIVDGGEAVRFLVRIKELIEDPESLLLEG